MSVQKIQISDLISTHWQLPIFDVRSPGEYAHAHIPGAYSLPLFTNEERAVIGTTYKIQGKQRAIKFGLDYFGHRMRKMVEEVETVLKKAAYHDNKIIVHCWRGGMRSSAVAWLLDFYGFEVMLIEGGYKSFRSWVLQQFKQPYNVSIVGGYTGSGKTLILEALKQHQQSVIDLEQLALHKGSAFGGIGMPEQPTQEMFENELALQLFDHKDHHFWLEDESQRIGRLNIPAEFWNQNRSAPVYFMDIPFEARLEHILEQYGKLPQENLINAVVRIQKKFGPNESKISIYHLLEGNTKEAFRLLLTYYDKQYRKSLYHRPYPENSIKTIASASVDPFTNASLIISSYQPNG